MGVGREIVQKKECVCEGERKRKKQASDSVCVHCSDLKAEKGSKPSKPSS